MTHQHCSAHIALLFIAACLFASAEGHGYLKIPASRNFLANSDYCPHCLSAGGPGTVGAGGKIWPAGNHGICGDPAADPTPRKHEPNGVYWTGKPTVTYQQGGVVKFTTVLTAFHRGLFGYRVCKIDGTSAAAESAQLTEACFNKNILVQANVPGAQAPGDPYFHLGSNNTGTFEAYYQLPSGLVCDGTSSRCVVQWWYLTGNSCNPPNEPSQNSVGGLSTCGTPGANYPEEFWNCADIAISGSGSTPSPSPKASPIPSPTPSPTPVPSPVASPSPKASPTPYSPSPMPSPAGPPTEKSCASGDAACFCGGNGGVLGTFADPAAGCKSYYECASATQVYYRSCPTGLLFSEKNKYCDWATSVTCPTSGTSPTPTPVPSPSPSPKSSPPAVLKSPPPKAVSSPPPSPVAVPSPSPSPSPKASPSPSSSPSPTCASGDQNCYCKSVAPATGMFSDELSGCKNYYWCAGPGQYFYKSCGSGLLFNNARQYCDWDYNVKC